MKLRFFIQHKGDVEVTTVFVRLKDGRLVHKKSRRHMHRSNQVDTRSVAIRDVVKTIRENKFTVDDNDTTMPRLKDPVVRYWEQEYTAG